MKNLISKIVVFVFGAGFFTIANAQSSNQIQEVNLKNDAFKTVRELVDINFCTSKITEPEGKFTSNVSFSLTDSGKITDVKAEGNNKEVNKELEEVFKSILYKIDTHKVAANRYVMPINVELFK